ncbi:HutD family protein [Sinomonas sp. ASV322]|uniref:HutD/Ves family protein n=1 Tax=Sinomonas sp. ASV322 TaxID=3041920 RepID=UPI0027DC503B|nr:HutD family protein [Sinomonas sp. ASV322]MDQ4503570.1 HutD family protein [Sinomonas sp. ASV322]
MPTHIIRFDGLPRTPWRNGGGTTVEIARGPESDGEAWGWRLSVADVERAGAFSEFPGMDRVLTVIDGELLVLTVDGGEHGLERYRPFRFDGGAPASAVLPTGSIRDLGLITRRGAFTGHVTILELSKKRPFPVGRGQLAVLLQGDAVASADAGDAGTPLARYDAVVGDDPAPTVAGRGFLAIVSVDAVDGE